MPGRSSQQSSSAGPARACRGVWVDVLRIEQGEFVGLLGENGSGKSTLLRALLGRGAAGARRAPRCSAARRGGANREIGYLPQRPSFGAGIALRGVDLVRLGLDGDRWGLPLPVLPGAAQRRRQARARVAEAIELVGAAAYAERPLSELSGGEQQRLLIAQALVARPRLLLLDEPLDSLDLPNQAAVAALVDRICRSAGVAVVLVAHDVNPLLSYLDRVAYLAAGHAVAGPVEEVITTETLTALYGVPVEVLQASDGRLVVIGQPEPPAHHHDRHADHASMPLEAPSPSWNPLHDLSQMLEYHFMVNALRGGQRGGRAGGARRLDDGAAARDLRRPHARDDGLPGRGRGGARGRAGDVRLPAVLRRRRARDRAPARRRPAPGAKRPPASAWCRRSRSASGSCS